MTTILLTILAIYVISIISVEIIVRSNETQYESPLEFLKCLHREDTVPTYGKFLLGIAVIAAYPILLKTIITEG